MTSEIRLRAEGIEWREVDGEIVALDLGSSSYLAANKTATVLWPELVDGTTRESLVKKLVDAYGLDEEAAGRDVDAFVDQLRENGMLGGEGSNGGG